MRLLFAIPQPTEEQILAGEAACEADRQERARLSERETRQRRAESLDRAPDCQLTDVARASVVSGVGLCETPALIAARGWLNSPNAAPVLALAGGPGCGKSVAAAWVVATAGGLWVSAEQAVRVFASNFGEPLEEQRRLRECGLLVVDDVGTELDAQRMAAALIELLNARKSRRRRTVLTLNLGKSAFVARYASDRLGDRMHESCEWVSCGGENLRRSRHGR